MDLYIIRHGQAISNLSKEPMADGELTELGRSQAEEMTRFMEGASLDYVISSPLMRAIETAQPLARSKGLPINVWTEAHEIWNLAPFRGLKPDEMKQRYPEIQFSDEPDKEGWQCAGYETSDIGYDRAVKVYQRILREFSKDQKIAIIGHGGFNRRLLFAALGVSNQFAFRVNCPNCSVWWIKIKEEKTVIQYIGNPVPLLSICQFGLK